MSWWGSSGQGSSRSYCGRAEMERGEVSPELAGGNSGACDSESPGGTS